MPGPRRSWPRAAVLAGGLLGYAAVVYLLVVVGIGRLVPAAGSTRPVLTGLAAVVVAVTLEPLSRRLGSLLPASAEERLRRLVPGGSDPRDIGARLDQLVALVGKTLGATARVTLTADLGAGLTASWRWPADDRTAGDRDAVRRPVLRGDRVLGALTAAPGAGRTLTPVEQRLVDDAADLASLVIEGARMDQTLQQLVTEAGHRQRELEQSRNRVLSAMEDERRRLERDIHDGAQQHLVALVVNLRRLQLLLARDPERARAAAGQVREALRDAVETLDQLSRGLYPTVLADVGPGVALRSAVRASPVPVVLHTDVRRRWPAPAEGAAYFSALEAVQNAIKHAGARQIVVTLTDADDRLTFAVADDGRGFDPATTPPGSGLLNLHDRVSGAGGRLTMTSVPGGGTTVTGWIPVPAPLAPATAA